MSSRHAVSPNSVDWKGRFHPCSSRVIQWFSTGLVAAGMLSALISLVAVTYLGALLARSDIANIRGDEPYFVTGVLRVLSGDPLYTDPSDFPFCLTGYTPAAYYAAAWAASVGGASEADLSSVVRAARTGSVILALLHALLMFALLWKSFCVRISVALLVCAVVYAIRAPWGFLVRPDSLYSLFFLASIGLCLADCGGREYSRKITTWTVLAGVFAGLAFLTKQTGAQLPILAVSFYMFTLDWRRIIAYSAGWVAPVAVVALLIAADSEPGWSSGALLLSHGGVRSIESLASLFGRVFVDMGGGVFIAGAVPAWIAWLSPVQFDRRSFLAWLALGCLGISCVSVLSSGSAEHYLHDALTLAGLSLAAYWGAEICGEDEISADYSIRNCTIAAYCVLFLPFFIYTNGVPYLKHTDRIADRFRVREEMEHRLKEFPGCFLLTVDNTLANSFSERAAVPQLYYASIFQRGGGVEFSKLQAGLESGKVRWCLIGAEQDLAHQLGNLKLTATKFEKKSTVDGFAIWEYRD